MSLWVFLHEEMDLSDDCVIETHLLSKGKKDKVFQMKWNLVILVLEEDFVFFTVVGAAWSQHSQVLLWVFLHEEMDLSDD